MENGTAEKKAIAKLSAMEINKRKSAVAEDVQSKRDRYSKISSIELAALLGIDEGGRPGCGEASWSFYRYVEKMSINEHLWNTGRLWTPAIWSALEMAVTKERLDEIDALDESDGFTDESNEFIEEKLTQDERDIILNALYEEIEENLEDGPYYAIARSCVTTEDGVDLLFEGDIEDDGVCLGLRTPYDQRDGKFVDLDTVLYVAW